MKTISYQDIFEALYGNDDPAEALGAVYQAVYGQAYGAWHGDPETYCEDRDRWEQIGFDSAGPVIVPVLIGGEDYVDFALYLDADGWQLRDGTGRLVEYAAPDEPGDIALYLVESLPDLSRRVTYAEACEVMGGEAPSLADAEWYAVHSTVDGSVDELCIGNEAITVWTRAAADLTRRALLDLQHEAMLAGDAAQVRLCTSALTGDPLARQACVEVVQASLNQEERQ